ncbi:MAG: hypothetical protein WAO98_02840 [Alphaproteobacteria bacterium]
MPKFRITHNLMIASTVFALQTISAMAANVTESYTTTINTSATPSTTTEVTTTTKSLGTLNANEVNAPQPALRNTLTDAQKPAPHMSNYQSVLQPMQIGGIWYVTGGIGDEERDELKAVKGDYNFHVMSASKNGAFEGDTHIAISDRQGNQLLNTAIGPLFYAKLPAGSYAVEASNNGQVKRQNISVNDRKSANMHLSW